MLAMIVILTTCGRSGKPEQNSLVNALQDRHACLNKLHNDIIYQLLLALYPYARIHTAFSDGIL